MGKKLAVILAALVMIAPCAVRSSGTASAADAATSVRLPVVMYHDIMKTRTGRYIVSPAQLESDIAALAGKGCSFVSPDEVIAYAEGRGTLPQKPVMLTFDDGHYNNAYYGLPVFEKYDAKVTFAIVGEYADRYSESVKSERDNPNYSCLTWDEIKELSETGLVSFASHSYAFHGQGERRGVLPKKGESDERYVEILTEDTEKLQERFAEYAGGRSEVYAYPYGLYKPITRSTLEKLGYKMMLTCNEQVSVVRRGEPCDIKALGRFNREGSYSTAELLKKLGV